MAIKRSVSVVVDWKPDKTRTMLVYRQIVRFVCGKIVRGD